MKAIVQHESGRLGLPGIAAEARIGTWTARYPLAAANEALDDLRGSAPGRCGPCPMAHCGSAGHRVHKPDEGFGGWKP